LDDLVRDEVGHSQKHAGDDDEADDHPSGLHHLPTVRPLYPLKLAPASLKEMNQATAGPGRRVHSGRGSKLAPAVAAGSAAASPAPPWATTTVAPRPDGLLLQLLLRDWLGRPGPSQRQLRLCQFDVRRSVLERVWRLVVTRLVRLLAACGPVRLIPPRGAGGRDPGLSDGTVGRPVRPPFTATFAVASHGTRSPLAQRVSR
jgi:hypothetical protein